MDRQIRQYVKELIRLGLTEMPETRPALMDVQIHPEHLSHIFSDCFEITKQLMNLTATDLGVITKVNSRFTKKRVYREQGANFFRQELEQAQLSSSLLGFARDTLNPAAPYYADAIQQLVFWMRAAHTYAHMRSSARMSDTNSQTHNIIWTQTQIKNPEKNVTAVQTVIAYHAVERFLAFTLNGKNVPMAEHKDFFTNAVQDTIAYDVAKFGAKSQFYPVYSAWIIPKDQGGVGWTSPVLMQEFKEAIPHQTP